jgi:LPS-assembly protein
VEMNFKAARTWKGVENNLLDVEDLRHIIQPGINYVYLPTPNVLPPQLPQFDYESINIRPLPVDFPDYNSIDSINSQNTLRVGVMNKVQTKRKGKVANLFQWSIFTDWHIDKRADQQNFGDMYSQFDFMPRDWLALTSEMRYNINQPDVIESNHYLTFTPQSNWSYSIGHRYMADQPLYGGEFGSDLLISRLLFKLNENWAVSAYNYYDLKYNYMPEQAYSIYRDLRSWTAALSFRWRKEMEEQNDFTVAFVFSFKGIPRSNPLNDQLDSSLLFGN